MFELVDTRYTAYAFKLLKRYAAREVGISRPVRIRISKIASRSVGKG